MGGVSGQRERQLELEHIRRDLDTMAERRLLRAFDDAEMALYCALLLREHELLTETAVP